MRFTFGTSILVYALDRSAGERHQVAKDLVSRARSEEGLVLTLQSLSELFRTLTAKKRVSALDASRLVEDLMLTAEIVAADQDCLSLAMRNVDAHGLSFWDAMIWATAARAGCKMLVSEDGQHGRILDGVTLVDPFRPDGSQFIERFLA
jgi:predicted nucleic acid-binding protein